MRGLSIAGFTSLSTLDFPGKLAAVIYTQGCPLQCRYCHNATLQEFLTHREEEIFLGEFSSFLARRAGFLDAVVFSGGEPLSQPGLGEAMAQVKSLGFLVGLHTAGVLPSGVLKGLLPLLDFVALDIKASKGGYMHVTGCATSGLSPYRNLDILYESKVPFEIRTTCHPLVLDEDQMDDLARGLDAYEGVNWSLQSFRAEGCIDEELVAGGDVPVSEELLARMRALAPNINIEIR